MSWPKFAKTKTENHGGAEESGENHGRWCTPLVIALQNLGGCSAAFLFCALSACSYRSQPHPLRGSHRLAVALVWPFGSDDCWRQRRDRQNHNRQKQLFDSLRSPQRLTQLLCGASALARLFADVQIFSSHLFSFPSLYDLRAYKKGIGLTRCEWEVNVG